jgi:hypothetical protein
VFAAAVGGPRFAASLQLVMLHSVITATAAARPDASAAELAEAPRALVARLLHAGLESPGVVTLAALRCDDTGQVSLGGGAQHVARWCAVRQTWETIADARSLALAPRDVLVVSLCGVIDAVNPAGVPFRGDGVMGALVGATPASAAEVARRLGDALVSWTEVAETSALFVAVAARG